MRIAYDGDTIEGWQRQPGKRTVQGLIEDALSSLDLPMGVHGSSRTDAGVHAVAQVAHFDHPGEPGDLDELRARLHRALPMDVRIASLTRAPPRFHARWSSRGKVYGYLLSTPADLGLAAEDPLLSRRSWILPDPRAFPESANQSAMLDEEAMARALRSLLGRRDFAGLATTRDPRKGRAKTTRKLGAARIVAADYPGPAGGRLVYLTVAGDAFLKHMVRNLTGLLAQVGYGEVDASEVSELVAERRRHRGPRAPGRGLTLLRVRYPRPLEPNW